jgi:hypothetical protein
LIVYIAGPMTGMPNWNRDAFLMAELRFTHMNHTVLNPCNNIPLHEPEAISHDSYMKIAYAMLDACDTVYFLKGWENSKGAQLEHQYASKHDKTMMYEGEWR